MTRVFFVGEKPVGEWAFAHMLDRSDDQFRVIGAVSNADASAGWWNSHLVMDLAKARGIPFFDSGDTHGEVLSNLVAELRPDVLVIAQGRTIITESALRLVGGQAFNLHLAPLPRYRGFYTANHALLEGATEFGATVHWVDVGIDTGGIVHEEKFEIAKNETAQSLYAKSVLAGMVAFQVLIDALACGKSLPRHPQVGEPRYFTRDALSIHRRIHDMTDNEEVDRKARAFYFPGFPPAYFSLGAECFAIMPASPPEPAITVDRVSDPALRMLQASS